MLTRTGRPGTGSALLLPAGHLRPPGIQAHDGVPPAPHDLWTAWNVDPVVVLGLVVVTLLYATGVGIIWRRAGTGRGISRPQAAAGAGGLVLLGLALISPLDRLALALFSAHMVQHLVLILLAAPLLVTGRVEIGVLWALPRRWRSGWLPGAKRNPVIRSVSVLAGSLLAAWILQSVALWLWHLPALYQAALGSAAVHALEHASFLGAAVLFWWALVHSGRRGSLGLGYALGILAVFTLAMESTLLGALLTFATAPWYPAYEASVGAWGLSPLDDQQLAGLIMWIPGGLIYLGVTLWLMAVWFRQTEEDTRRREGREQAAPGN